MDIQRAGLRVTHPQAAERVAFQSHLDRPVNKQQKWLVRLRHRGRDLADPLELFDQHRESMQQLVSMLGASTGYSWSMHRLRYVPEYPSCHWYGQVSADARLRVVRWVQPKHSRSVRAFDLCSDHDISARAHKG